MNKEKSTFLAGCILLMFFFSGIGSNLEVSHFNAKSQLNLSPKNSSDYVSLSYCIFYDIEDENPNSDDFQLYLQINGTNLLYENGTIQYQLSKPIDNEKVIDKLAFLFGDEHTDFFTDYQDEDSLITEFSYRKEHLPDSGSNFSNATYTMFWINSSDRPTNFLHDFQQIPFLKVSDPVMLTLRKDHPYVAAPIWSPEIQDLRKHQQILPTYYLTLNLNGEITLKLYYDMMWSILLRSEMEYVNPNDESRIFIRIYLDSSSLELIYEDENPYWLEYRRQLLIYGGIGGGAVIFGNIAAFLIIRKKKKGISNKKVDSAQDLLDRI
ncbi:MAG: hypothetical protein ACTSWC_03685 [Promethearchaeota archaeon]